MDGGARVGSLVVFTGDSPMPNLPALLAAMQFLIALDSDSGWQDAGGRDRHWAVSGHRIQQWRADADRERDLLAGPAVCRSIEIRCTSRFASNGST